MWFHRDLSIVVHRHFTSEESTFPVLSQLPRHTVQVLVLSFPTAADLSPSGQIFRLQPTNTCRTMNAGSLLGVFLLDASQHRQRAFVAALHNLTILPRLEPSEGHSFSPRVFVPSAVSKESSSATLQFPSVALTEPITLNSSSRPQSRLPSSLTIASSIRNCGRPGHTRCRFS